MCRFIRRLGGVFAASDQPADLPAASLPVSFALLSAPYVNTVNLAAVTSPLASKPPGPDSPS
jgi:hypothetical protein